MEPARGGFLTGKYRRDDPRHVAANRGPALPDGRADAGGEQGRLAGANPFGDSKFTGRNWNVLDAVQQVAAEAGVDAAQVAGTLLGVSRVEQLRAGIASLALTLDAAQRSRLDDVGAPDLRYPATLFDPTVRRFVFGGHDVRGWEERDR